MGRGSGSVDQSACCRVLPIIDEESESESSPESEDAAPETKAAAGIIVAERRKAIVSRMGELLRRAAAQSLTQAKLRSSTVATANKWKKRVARFKNGAGARKQQDQRLIHGDGMSSSSTSVSSKNSSWDFAAAESFPSPAGSPLWLAPAFVSEKSTTEASFPGTRRVSGSSCSCRSDDEMETTTMAQWITTDSEFVVLEL